MPIQITSTESDTNIDVTIVEEVFSILITENRLSVEVNPQAPLLDNIPDVAVSNLQDGDTLLFDGIDRLWRNIPPAAASGNVDGGTFF